MKLLIVDDHSLMREGVAEILRQAEPGTVVLQAGTIADGIAITAAHAGLDAILLDLRFPDSSGLNALAQFRVTAPGTPVLILSSSEDPADVRKALAQGAMGYVTKSASTKTLMSALRLVIAGEIYLPPLLAELAAMARVTPAERAILTGRQREVLEAIGRGLSNKDIGLELDLSEKTVKTHITAIFRALGVVNRTQAVHAARQARLLTE